MNSVQPYQSSSARAPIGLIGKNIEVNPMPATPGSPERRCPSITKLKEAVLFKKKYPLEIGLQETFNWYSKNVFSGQEVSAV